MVWVVWGFGGLGVWGFVGSQKQLLQNEEQFPNLWFGLVNWWFGGSQSNCFRTKVRIQTCGLDWWFGLVNPWLGGIQKSLLQNERAAS